jgi:hypothetical protein
LAEDLCERYIQKFLRSKPVKVSSMEPHRLFKLLKSWVIFPTDLSDEQLDLVIKHYPWFEYIKDNKIILISIKVKLMSNDVPFTQFALTCTYHNTIYNMCDYGNGVSEFGCSIYKCPMYCDVVKQEIKRL